MKTKDLRRFNTRPPIYDHAMPKWNFRFPLELVKRIRERAKQEGTNMNQWVRDVCFKALTE